MKKQLNKIIVFLLCFTLLTSVFPAFAAENAQGGFEPAEYSEAVSMLNDLGIMDNNYFAQYDASVTITRGEFAALSIAVLGLSDEAKSTTNYNKFVDVADDYPYAKEINLATSLGLFNGVSETEFAPNEPIYITQAIKVAVSMLGYNEIAQYRGGYPSGYLTIARELDILDGVVMNNETPALRGNVIVLMYNSLFADVLDITGIDGGSFSYDITKGTTLLSHYHKIYEGEGVVTANWQYALSGDAEVPNYVAINGKRFYTQSKRALNVVGKNVEYYYVTSGSKDVILTLREKDNSVVTIKADDNYTFDYANGRYTLSGDDKNYEFNLRNYDIIYNYGGISSSLSVDYNDILTPDVGSITLIDNNEDSIYDVVIIEEADLLLFKSFDDYGRVIYDINDRSRDIDFDDYKNVSVTDVNGNEVVLSEVTEKTVFMLYKSYDNKYVKLVMCTDIVEGKVDEIMNDEIVIGSSKYSVAPVTRLVGLRPGQTYLSTVLPGKFYRFYLNQYNQVVFHESTNSTGFLGYIAKIASSSQGFSDKVSVQILSNEGKLEAFDFAKKVKIQTINGINTYSDKQVENILAENANLIYGGSVPNPDNRLFVRYDLNSDGEISLITLPYVINNEEEYNNPPSNYSFFKVDYAFSKYYNSAHVFSSLYYRAWIYSRDNNTFSLTILPDSKASIFYVPDTSDQNYTDSLFQLRSVSSLAKDTRLILHDAGFTGGNENVELYSTDSEVRLINAIVWHKASGIAESLSNHYEENCLVTGISQVSSGKNESLLKITVIKKGKVTELLSDNADVIKRATFEDTLLDDGDSGSFLPTLLPEKSSIVIGDVIRYSTNPEGYVEDIALIYDSETGSVAYPVANLTKQSAKYRQTSGVATDKFMNFTKFEVIGQTPPATDEEFHDLSMYRRIYVFDYKTNEGRVGSSKDIAIGDKVYLTMYLREPGELIVYKGGNR